MAEQPKPRLRLVDEALAADPPVAGQEPLVRKVLERYAPSIRRGGIAAGRNETLIALGAQSVEEASQLTTLRTERDERPTLGEYRRHGMARLWLGGVIGIALGSALVFGIVSGVTDVAFGHAERATQQGALVGAAAASQDPAQRGRDVPHVQNAPASAP